MTDEVILIPGRKRPGAMHRAGWRPIKTRSARSSALQKGKQGLHLSTDPAPAHGMPQSTKRNLIAEGVDDPAAVTDRLEPMPVVPQGEGALQLRVPKPRPPVGGFGRMNLLDARQPPRPNSGNSRYGDADLQSRMKRRLSSPACDLLSGGVVVTRLAAVRKNIDLLRRPDLRPPCATSGCSSLTQRVRSPRRHEEAGLGSALEARDWTYPAEALGPCWTDGRVGVEVESIYRPGPPPPPEASAQGRRALGFSPQLGPHVQDLGHLSLR